MSFRDDLEKYLKTVANPKEPSLIYFDGKPGFIPLEPDSDYFLFQITALNPKEIIIIIGEKNFTQCGYVNQRLDNKLLNITFNNCENFNYIDNYVKELNKITSLEKITITCDKNIKYFQYSLKLVEKLKKQYIIKWWLPYPDHHDWKTFFKSSLKPNKGFGKK